MHECNMIGCVYSFVLASLMSVARLSQPRNSTLSSHMIQKPPRGAHQNMNSISKIFALRTKGCACKRYCTENAYHLALLGGKQNTRQGHQSHLHRNTSLPSPMLCPAVQSRWRSDAQAPSWGQSSRTKVPDAAQGWSDSSKDGGATCEVS
jgi:hypothetical protein